MSCDFKPGDGVVCVDATVLDLFPDRQPNADVLVAGFTYTVAAVSWDEEADCSCLHLIEVKNGPPWCEYPDEGFWSFRFRKIEPRTDKLNLTEWLAQPTGYDEEQANPAPKAPAKKRERVE